MAENKSRYVLVCQQALVFASVAAVGLSAVGVVELRIVAPSDSAAGAAGAGGRHVVAAETAMVSSAPVKSHVRTVPLGGSAVGGMRLPQLEGKAAGPRSSRSGDKAVVTSLPESAT